MRIRAWIYDRFLIGLTSGWYAEVLERLPAGARLLDVGVGTAGALLANADLVRGKRLQVTGIDIDADYVERARERLAGSALDGHVAVHRESVYDHRGGPYDAVYFSASFMIRPDPEGALRHCCGLLGPGGRIFFTQTIQNEPSPGMERLKPLLGRLTSIEFGRVTYASTFRAQIEAAGLELEHFRTLGGHGSRSYCLAVARPPS